MLQYASSYRLKASRLWLLRFSMFDEVYAWNRTNLPKFFEIYLYCLSYENVPLCCRWKWLDVAYFRITLVRQVFSFSSSLIFCWLCQSISKLPYSSRVSHVANWRFYTFPCLSSSSILFNFANLFCSILESSLSLRVFAFLLFCFFAFLLFCF